LASGAERGTAAIRRTVGVLQDEHLGAQVPRRYEMMICAAATLGAVSGRDQPATGKREIAPGALLHTAHRAAVIKFTTREYFDRHFRSRQARLRIPDDRCGRRPPVGRGGIGTTARAGSSRHRYATDSIAWQLAGVWGQYLKTGRFIEQSGDANGRSCRERLGHRQAQAALAQAWCPV